jgi:hypothetical protein
LLATTREGWCAIKTVKFGLAIVSIFAAAVVFVLLVRLIRSTEEVARLLRTEREVPAVVTGEEDASSRAPPSAPDGSPDAVAGRGRARPLVTTNEPADDGGIDGVMPSEDAAAEDAAGAIDEGVPPEAAPVAEPPRQIQCGWRMCPEGEVCCNWSCSTCAPPGQICDYFCGAPSIAISIPCGPNTCNVTEVCCNRTCGICVPSGETCSQEPCPNPIYDPYSAPCGLNTCNVGEVCCNPSCGICTKPGERCSIEPCP